MPEPITLAEILKAARDAHSEDIHTAMPAKVVVFHPERGTVDVLPQIKTKLRDEDDAPVFEDIAIIPDVPIAWPRGGGYCMTLPLQPNDFVWLIFSEAPMGEWRNTGQLSEPLDSRRHSVGYPVAYPGVYPDTQMLSVAALELADRISGMVLGRDGSQAGQILLEALKITLAHNQPQQTTLDASGLTVGLAGATPVALQSLLTTLITAFNTHTHAETGTNTGPPAATVINTGGATLLKAK